MCLIFGVFLISVQFQLMCVDFRFLSIDVKCNFLNYFICDQWRIQGGGQSGIRPWPPIEIGNGVWPPPLWDRKSNGSIVILLESKEFGPPVLMSAVDLAPPWKNSIYKTQKRSMTKKKKKRS